MWRNVKLSPLAKVKEQACANGFNSRDKDHKLSIWFQIDFSWSNKISTTLLRLGVEVYFMKILNVSFSYAKLLSPKTFWSIKYRWTVMSVLWSFLSDHQQLASHMCEIFSLKNKFITYPDWRTFSERSRRMLLLWFK